ncbi:MAG: tetratricopeptide repeat protein [Gemmatimonadota bacterium]|nr:tetratricopeptide repeat protein [Gemmatimonadota bacterium]
MHGNVHYRCVVFADLERHSEAWGRLPRERMLALLGEYRSLAERVASQYGCVHRNFTGDGHLFLFESPDAGVRFGLQLVKLWRDRVGEALGNAGDLQVPLRIGCHFGECVRLEGEAWVGRGIVLTKRVESAAGADSLLVTENVLDLIDLPLYRVEVDGPHALEGDHLRERRLHRILAFEEREPEERPDRPMTAEDWFLKAAALIGTEREDTAEEEEAYRKALELQPDYPEAHNNLAILLRGRGREEEAERHYREALRLRPEYAEAHYNFARLLEDLDRPDEAASHYRDALESRPDYVEALHAHANLLRTRGALAEAEDRYRRAIELRPSPEIHNDLAVLLEDRGRVDEAMEQFRRALEMSPDHPQAHYNYAFLLEREGRSSEAEEHYRAAIDAWPEYAEAHNNLAALLHERGKLDEAEKHYHRAFELRPDDPQVRHNYELLRKSRRESER